MKTQLHEGGKRKGEERMGDCWILKWIVFVGKEQGLVMRLKTEVFLYSLKVFCFHSGQE